MTEAPDQSLRRAALVVATMASFLTPFLASAVNVALPAIGTDLGMDPVQLSWVATSFLLTSAVCLVPFGRMADMVGRKKVFLGGMLLFTLTTLACGFARSAAGLILLRALQGVGGAMIFGTGLAILTSVYPPGERGRVIGFNASAVYIGLSVGPFAGGVLTRHFGWPSVFWASVPLSLASVLVTWLRLKGEWSGAPGGRFDATGSVIYGLALTALMIGLSWLPGTAGAILAVIGLAGLAGFIFWERRAAHPVFDVALLESNPVFALSNLAAFINYCATFAVTFLLSLYLQYVRGLDPRQAGMILLVQSILMAAVSPLAGRLSDRVEPRLIASTGMGLTVAGLIWLGVLPEQAPFAVIIAALMVLGVGFGLFSSPNTNAVMSSVEKRHYGVASAMLGTMRLTGQMVSMGVAVMVLALLVGRGQLTAAQHARFVGAMHVAFLIFAAFCAVGVFASLARGNVRQAGTPPIPANDAKP
ncbi:MAG: MFS transporter [Opitutaceae bacterium]|nr:MFS transporter [Opitutaceae bacterium]